ncbi:MAG TPA: acetyl-CoA carboxylase biotin carboxyl carrier protein [Polyangia bacterium]|nr:acetyl-CoA carboxylase biotin carboxyl carrier protein [Polyangia bacterium]
MAKKDSKERAAGKGSRPLQVVKEPNGRARATSAEDDGFDAVRALARIATEFDLTEIEVGSGGQIRVRRGGVVGPVASAPASVAAAPRSIALTPPVAAAETPGTFITSPFVGTFYRAPSPEAPSFVDVGKTVRKGQVVCIVEAMKLMNEIEAEADGKVEEILVKNGEHVEYGQHLIRLSPS